METWLTYRPQDFLLFSPEVYFRLFARVNEAWWPLPPIASLAALALGAAVLRKVARAAAITAVLLALASFFVARAFIVALYEPINFAAGPLAVLFYAQGALLLAFSFAVSPSQPRWRMRLGAALWGLAVAYPLLAPLSGRPLLAGEWLAIAPDPTAIATLGLLFATARGPALGLCAPIPIVWLLVSAATLLTMGAPTGWLVLVVAAVSAAALLASALLARPPTRSRRSRPVRSTKTQRER